MKHINFKSLAILCFGLIGSFSTLQAEVQYASPLTVNGEEFEIGNLLEWSTSFEQESAFFYIEKSIDGVNFENVGNVEAAGDSDEEIKYRYMDIQVTDMEATYRLRQVEPESGDNATVAPTPRADRPSGRIWY